MSTTIRVALAGNPNSGKTSLFNHLTGARQHVGNYPGVTVERREGRCKHKAYDLYITDLPGTYSLTAYSIEEIVARDYIVEEKPDIVVDVVDASNLERNLYLAVQLIELGVPLILAFNMSDIAKARGVVFDLDRLSAMLGAPIVPTVAVKGTGGESLKDAVAALFEKKNPRARPVIAYGRELDAARDTLAQALNECGGANGYPAEWAALKLLEEDVRVRGKVERSEVLERADSLSAQLEKWLGDAPENLIAEARYGFISEVCRETVRSPMPPQRNLSDRIDAIVTHRVLALPLFLAMMYGVFQLTFTIGGPPMDWIDAGFGWLGDYVSGWWPEGPESALRSLLVDGIIAGVGGVVIFLPNILLLFLAISILEDTGYMARAAFIMDRVMHRIGLQGKSFIPMLIGFGCSVPAIMATRTLDNQRDRITTILVTPLMSCGARLPIYALIIPAFFPEQWHAPMLWLIYIIGAGLAIAVAKLLRVTVLEGEAEPLVMELPPYRIPALRSVLMHVWERGGLYLKKAGTVILGVSILLWAMTTYPQKTVFDRDYDGDIARLEAQGKSEEAAALGQERHAETLAYTITGRAGRMLEPLLRPLGFDWRIGTALIGAFAAKEVFVAQMGIVYSLGETGEDSEALRGKLREHYSPLVGFCIMLFCLISAPCMATIAVTKRETNSWKWALLQLGGLTALAYGITFAVYQAGWWCGIGTA